jgi:hypothetical protein
MLPSHTPLEHRATRSSPERQSIRLSILRQGHLGSRELEVIPYAEGPI